MLNAATIQYPFSQADLNLRVAYTAAALPEYIGRCQPNPNMSTASPVWQIVKCTYDADGNLTATAFAGGTNDYNKVWDNRTAYTY